MTWRGVLISGCFLIVAGRGGTVPGADIELIARGGLSATATDLSGLDEPLAPGIPHSRLGGFSALAYSGAGRKYFALPDRGPQDGAFPYKCRFHALQIALPAKLAPGSIGELTIKLEETYLLTADDAQPMIGLAAAFDGHRCDPEGLRTDRDGRVFISDEYGPHVMQFTGSGQLVREFAIPPRFRVAHPSESKDAEAQNNATGRQPNRGFEGLALTPDGRHVVAILQGPLIQDSSPKGKSNRFGVNVRMLDIAVDSGDTREFVYQLDDDGFGISEILAIDDGSYLVLERDGKGGVETRCKKIMLARCGDGATDVSDVDQLPPGRGLPADVHPLEKTVLLDLLDPQFGLAGETFPEKVEGLAFGPTLADGRRLLLVCVDNDFLAEQPSAIYAFAIAPELLPGYGWGE